MKALEVLSERKDELQGIKGGTFVLFCFVIFRIRRDFTHISFIFGHGY